MVANGEGKDGFILLSRGYLESHQMAFQQYRKYSFDYYTLIFIHANCSCKALGPATNDSKPLSSPYKSSVQFANRAYTIL